MSNEPNPIGWLTTNGAAFQIGQAMGAQGRDAVHRHLVPSKIWATVTHPRHDTTIERLMLHTRSRFPHIWDELCGIAEGLQLPQRDVFAWNCRGDILASAPDGCTTIQQPGPNIGIAHNEDGLPFFRGSCFILDARPELGLGFRAFCYPGSLPGHTFGWNDAGLCQAVNNLRLTSIAPDIPRMVLGRAVLGCATLDESIRILSDAQSGGFHMSLAQVGDPRLLSVEYGGGQSVVRQITQRAAHANHALHLDAPDQIVTGSSHDRQQRADQLVIQSESSALDILRDEAPTGLPIRRDDPADPDHENTLATCVFTVSNSGIDWRVYGEKQGGTAYQSESSRV
ncbi:C45 family peptidase [uncultured Aliiroseovarius sp.]|uniref:C45 family autoproteolytic acyltransferase/hydolase n=1 Tax=uncultured Aliiroseovarius sp. TaxID=1658783 RepID=UPI0025970EC3|nr:C45 family peptidase [uncultured Aliiroseovarius sp.]